MGSKGKPKETLQHLTRKPFESIRACYEELQGTSDRACALVAVAILDQKLMTLLKTKMIEIGSDDVARLFYDQQAAFSTFSSKIMTSWAFGLISMEERENLGRIRRIRNVFAHTVIKMGFDEPLIKQECEMLIIPDLPADPKSGMHPDSPRENFESSVVSQYTRLVQEESAFLRQSLHAYRRLLSKETAK